MSAPLEAARAYVGRGWPVLPIHPGGKAPLTAHGVKDASTDPQTIARWWRRWPDANVAVACGAPGPQVVDIDDMDAAAAMLADLEAVCAPTVATPRGRHFYFAGEARATVTLDYGEVRGRGSYVVAPPSVHASGKQYVWLAESRGPLTPAPAGVTRGAMTAGRGVMPDREQVPPGQMYHALLDLAHRLAQARVLNARVVERVLLVQFEAWRIPGASYGDPRTGRRDTRRIAEWAVTSDTAERERRQGRKGTPWRI